MIPFSLFLEYYLGPNVPRPGGGKTLPVFDASQKNQKKRNRNTDNQKWPTGRSEESTNEEYIIENEKPKEPEDE